MLECGHHEYDAGGRSPRGDADHLHRRVPRLRDVPDARRGDAVVDAPRRLPREPLLGARRLQHRRTFPWQGCSLHDLIQPAFSFLVGAALPFSIASRRAQGRELRTHARATPCGAALILILLGIFLRSMERPQTYWTFEDTLTQIGLGYTVALPAGVRVAARAGRGVRRDPRRLLGGLRALPAAARRASTTRASACRPGWPHLYTGFLAHFNKNSNLSWAFDTWFLNLFPRQSPFLFNERRLVDAQLHPHARHDDARACGRVNG